MHWSLHLSSFDPNLLYSQTLTIPHLFFLNGPLKLYCLFGLINCFFLHLLITVCSYLSHFTKLDHVAPSVKPADFSCSLTPFSSSLLSDLAVELGLLPLHLVELGLESFVLIGQHLEPVLHCGAFLLVAANQLAVDLVLERRTSKVRA